MVIYTIFSILEKLARGSDPHGRFRALFRPRWAAIRPAIAERMYVKMLIIPAVIPPLLIVILVNRYCGTKREHLKRFSLIFLISGLFITVAAMAAGDILSNAAGAVLGGGILFMLVNDYITAALFEEGLKYIILRWRLSKKDPFENPLYAIALSVTVTMGFSFYEQMVYTLGESIYSVLVRGVLSVPGHMAHAILMGWFLYLAARCASEGNDAGRKKSLRLALLVPVLTHGTFDLIVDLFRQTDSIFSEFLLVAYTAALVVYAIRLLRRAKREYVPAAPAEEPAPVTAAIRTAAPAEVIKNEDFDDDEDTLEITIE